MRFSLSSLLLLALIVLVVTFSACGNGTTGGLDTDSGIDQTDDSDDSDDDQSYDSDDPPDIEDFGPAPVVSNTFDVATNEDWEEALTAIRGGGNNKNYIVNITASFSIEGYDNYGDNTFGSSTGLQVSLRGNHTLSLSSDGSALRIDSGQNVVIRDVDFAGRTDNYISLLYLRTGALTLRGNASVSGNTGTYLSGGVNVSGGTFTMRDTAVVSGNTATSFFGGGGVFVESGTFTMRDTAIVSGNTAAETGSGVSVNTGSFSMRDTAVVSGNTADRGGGVGVNTGSFSMRDTAVVSSNTADRYGGGVYISTGTFTMQGKAQISGNTAEWGGGVCVDTNIIGLDTYGTFQIEGGKVYGATGDSNANRASSSPTAALIKDSYGTAMYGVLSGETFTSKGNLDSTDNTITVVNGVLQ